MTFYGHNKGKFKAPRPCSACGRMMVTPKALASGRFPGTVISGAKGLCHRDTTRLRRTGTTDAPPPRAPSKAPKRSREEVLEDYVAIRDSVSTIRQAAERMGMSKAALEQALYRARKTGDTRGTPPLHQLEQAVASNMVYRYEEPVRRVA